MASVLDFLIVCGRIKRTVRTGWIHNGVNNPENVSDHMYRMGIMSFLLPDEVTLDEGKVAIDKTRVMKLAIVHDLAECIVGDITPNCGVSREEKLSRERSAIRHICELAGERAGDELMNLWQEYVDRRTPEAIVCKDFDQFEMILQAYEYEVEEKRPGELQTFFDSTKDQNLLPTGLQSFKIDEPILMQTPKEKQFDTR